MANPQIDKKKKDGSMPPPSELQDIFESSS
jgi:hypothetical protein